MKWITVSSFVIALLLGLGASIALPANDASAHQAQTPTMGHGMMGSGTSGQGMMGPGMGGQGMMHPGMGGHGMMMRRSMGGQGMMGPGMGTRVVPISHLSTDDVRHFLGHRLDRQGYKRLKVGTVEERGDDTVVAEIVTADGSLVQRLEVDRHTGLIKQVD